MAYSYADRDETISDVLSEVKSEGDKETVGRIIEAASAMVDRFTNRPSGYFAAVTPTTPAVAADPDADPPVIAVAAIYPTSVRRYRGTGSNFLQTGRYIPGTLSIENVGTDLYYTNAENGWPFANDVAGQAGFADGGQGPDRYAPLGRTRLFSNGALYVVTAAWGFAETPADIVFATKQITQHVWDRGRGIIGELTPTGFVVERDMPLSAKTALTGWVKREFELN